MTCMLWDIESGVRLTEFSDHTGDVMRYSLISISNLVRQDAQRLPT
jgi:hypothetical protein